MRKTATDVSLSVLPGVSALSRDKPRHRISRVSGILATTLLCTAALSQPNLAYAGPHGGDGGFHGDGFHGGGFDAGRFRGEHGGWFERAHDHDRYRWRGFFGGFYGYAGWGYYCADPPGYYPYVTQCSTGWQTVPAS